jgi:hypothetical protein
MRAASVIKKITKVNKQQIGENSPNLVTLLARINKFLVKPIIQSLSTAATN